MKIRKAMFGLVTIASVFASGDLPIKEAEGAFPYKLSQEQVEWCNASASQLPWFAITQPVESIYEYNQVQENAVAEPVGKKRSIAVVGYDSEDSDHENNELLKKQQKPDARLMLKCLVEAMNELTEAQGEETSVYQPTQPFLPQGALLPNAPYETLS